MHTPHHQPPSYHPTPPFKKPTGLARAAGRRAPAVLPAALHQGRPPRPAHARHGHEGGLWRRGKSVGQSVCTPRHIPILKQKTKQKHEPIYTSHIYHQPHICLNAHKPTNATPTTSNPPTHPLTPPPPPPTNRPPAPPTP